METLQVRASPHQVPCGRHLNADHTPGWPDRRVRPFILRHLKTDPLITGSMPGLRNRAGVGSDEVEQRTGGEEAMVEHGGDESGVGLGDEGERRA